MPDPTVVKNRGSRGTTIKICFEKPGIIIRTSSKQTTKVTISSDLVGQTASGPPSYIQVRHAGADFLGPGAQKHQFKIQKRKKTDHLEPPLRPPQTL